VLLIAKHNKLLPNTSIMLASGKQYIKPIAEALGEEKAKALLGFHSFSGCDSIGRFAGHGKPTFFKQFIEADDDIIEAFIHLASEHPISPLIVNVLAKFVCHIYAPKHTNIDNLKDLRWYLFCQKMGESDTLPPTEATLEQHILRSHLQAFIWGQADVPMQNQPDPCSNGWRITGNTLKCVTTTLKPAPNAILELVYCKCKKTKCTGGQCSCKRKDLVCTDLCQCLECDNEDPSHVIMEPEYDV
jgi:hypothetical protein